MARYCKYCGGPLKDNNDKCGFCGKINESAQVPDHIELKEVTNNSQDIDFDSIKDLAYDPFNLFTFNEWKACYKKVSEEDNDFGLILTNSTMVLDRASFENNVKEYMASKKKEHITYILLDVYTQKVKVHEDYYIFDIVKMLNEIYQVAVPNYLLIMGDKSVIPSILFDNKIENEDLNVLSDLPYITLDISSPWSGKKYDFSDAITKVGRVPTKAENNFVEAFTYFKNVRNFEGYDAVDALSISAQVWIPTTKEIISSFDTEFITSPDYACTRYWLDRGYKDVHGKAEGHNLIYCNLHGSEGDFYWYGQIGNDYPEAFYVDCLPKSVAPYLVCTEACYGAKPSVERGEEQGILVSCLTHNAVGFVGSSRIAYGAINGGMTCADIIAHTFINEINKGVSQGTAFLRALRETYANSQNETHIKTIAEFMLYGDPSIHFIKSKTKGLFKKTNSLMSKTKDDASCAIQLLAFDFKGNISNIGQKGISLMAYDKSEKIKIEKMAKVATKSTKKLVKEKYEDFKDEEPLLYKVVGQDGFRAIYSKKTNKINKVMHVYFDEEGNEVETYFSK